MLVVIKIFSDESFRVKMQYAFNASRHWCTASGCRDTRIIITRKYTRTGASTLFKLTVKNRSLENV